MRGMVSMVFFGARTWNGFQFWGDRSLFAHQGDTVFSSVECVLWSGWGGCNDSKLSCASVLGGWSGVGWGIEQVL